MKKKIIILPVLLILSLLVSCGNYSNSQSEMTEEVGTEEAGTENTEVGDTEVEDTDIENTEIEDSETEVTETESEEEHSALYLPGYSVEEVLRSFNEVVLDAEYATGEGNTSLVQRWDERIYYSVEGSPTEDDLIILRTLFGQLNEIEGFPGIVEATNDLDTNLYIYFEDREAFDMRFRDFLQGEYANGATQYWYYTDTNNIYVASIGYCTDMPADVRESVLLEEVINCLGLSDSQFREDSIVYQYGDNATELSEMDWLILKLMYHPQIRCGMDVTECERVIRELYY